MWRLRPALPSLTVSCSILPTWPMVALQSSLTSRTSPEGESDLGHAVFLSHQLGLRASASNQLAALAGIQLNVVNDCTDRNVGERQSVARLDISRRAGLNDVAVG